MCGICGFASLEKVNCAVLERMNDSMIHRGPDDSGTEIFEPKYVNKLVNWYLRTGDQGLGTGNNYSRIVWPFFVFQQWYEYYI